MNRSELIRALSEKTGLVPENASRVVEIFFESMKDYLVRGERVEIRGFGSFKIKDYEGYAGRNPKSGESVSVLPKRLPFFRPGKELKEYVNS